MGTADRMVDPDSHKENVYAIPTRYGRSTKWKFLFGTFSRAIRKR